MCSFVENGKKIVGIASNYKSLLAKLKKPLPQHPGIFLKPSTSYVTQDKYLIIPQGFCVNQEVELGVIIGKVAKKVCIGEAMDYVEGYCVALDMTATCQLEKARTTGGSWTLGKSFDTACAVGDFLPKSSIKDPQAVTLYSRVNCKEKQNCCTSDMFFDIPTLISYISQYMTLEPNDLILTGTPPGMSPIRKDDVIEAGIEGLAEIKFRVEADE